MNKHKPVKLADYYWDHIKDNLEGSAVLSGEEKRELLKRKH